MLLLPATFIACLVFLFFDHRRSITALVDLLEQEQARSKELLELLEARAAPQQYHALVAEDHRPDPSLWVADDTGLLGYYEDPSDL